jgi:tetratricopeptide (TPR) repeat protein
MTPLLPAQYIHIIRAADGWRELGVPEEALRELESLPALIQTHPGALEVRFRLFADKLDWQAAFEISVVWTELYPQNPEGWILRAYAARRKPDGGLLAAFEVLESVVDRFPNAVVIPYNLACYRCQMGDLESARKWFDQAWKTGDHDTIREMALADDDLKALWGEIRKKR